MSQTPSRRDALHAEILRLAGEYASLAHDDSAPGTQRTRKFIPGETPVPYAARIFTGDEVQAAIGSTLDFWLTLGSEGEAFEQELATTLGVKRSILTNSGSSANLLAVSALTSAKLPPEKRLVAGDEIITAAAGFPTTVAPIVQNGLVPAFIDSDPLTGNIDATQLEMAFRPGKTKAVMLAHALGNPFDVSAVTAFCRQHDLWLIEDNCDALGSAYALPSAGRKGEGEGMRKIEAASAHDRRSLEQKSSHSPADKVSLSQESPDDSSSSLLPSSFLPAENARFTGVFGDLSTQSFYPPHHLTMGEGGAVNIGRDMRFKVIVESFRDWGRDCWCASGVDNTCGKRFGWQLGELPEGYDHKYIYSHLGYNLKPLDVQAAIGRVQLRRLAEFGAARRNNWQRLRKGLDGVGSMFEFMRPTHAREWISGGWRWDASGARSDPSWFGFMLLRREDAPFTTLQLARHLDEKKIGNRRLFGGNLVRQPAFVQLKRDNPDAFRVAGELKGADRLMRDALFVGVYPGLTEAMIDYVIETITAFCRKQ